jgi:hypothetical protein
MHWRLAIVMMGTTMGMLCPAVRGQTGPVFVRQVIDADFPGGYQVEVADVDGDGRADIVGVGGGTCAWYHNPDWTKRVITGPDRTPDIISSATADLDGDGRAEVAIGFDFEMTNPRRGKVSLAIPGRTLDTPWELRVVAESSPSIHRLRWGDVDGDRVLDLVASPIFAPEASAPEFGGDAVVRVYNRKPQADGTTSWDVGVGPRRPVLHAIRVMDLDRDGRDDVLTASNRGVEWHRMAVNGALRVTEWGWESSLLSAGAAGVAPKCGSSEVQVGRLSDGRRFVASIDPWHGSVVAVGMETLPRTLRFEPSEAIDRTLDDGHALWVADTDRDGDDEIFAGHRGRDARVSVYDFDGLKWNRTVMDREVAAQDLRGGDLDGDGTPDVVAIGGTTRNVVWYRPVPSR